MEPTTEVPPDIAHLDFEPYQEPTTVVEEKPKKQNVCNVLRPHPHDPERISCNRPAYVLVTVTNLPCCGWSGDAYFCKGCWTEVQAHQPNTTFRCATCKKNYRILDHITRWERV